VTSVPSGPLSGSTWRSEHSKRVPGRGPSWLPAGVLTAATAATTTAEQMTVRRMLRMALLRVFSLDET
jgi:hypothetical protein